MNTEQRYYKLLSLVMQYPDDAFRETLPTVVAEVERLPAGPPKHSLRTFIAHLKACDCLRLQAEYTALFDLNPATSLNLSYHVWGDGEKRARLLTELQQRYSAAGLEKATSELPDYLPLLLEFVATVPTARHCGPLQACWEGLERVIARLRESGPPYAALMSPLLDSLQEENTALAATNSGG
jgi:nitrate reductase molybdenum cofactor assembly chaperone NarJ/NarW